MDCELTTSTLPIRCSDCPRGTLSSNPCTCLHPQISGVFDFFEMVESENQIVLEFGANGTNQTKWCVRGRKPAHQKLLGRIVSTPIFGKKFFFFLIGAQ